MHFNKALRLGCKSPVQHYRTGAEWLENCLAERDPSVLIDSQMNTTLMTSSISHKQGDYISSYCFESPNGTSPCSKELPSEHVGVRSGKTLPAGL